MDFSVKDGKRLWSFLRRQEVLADKKGRWLGSTIHTPDGCSRRLKRPKFLADAYLAESDTRSEELSCEKVSASVEKSFSLQTGDYKHHLVQDGLRLLNLPRGEDGSLCPESLITMHSTVNKLSNEALQSVASIISNTKCSFVKTRLILRKIVTDHLQCYLAKLDNEDATMSRLSEILRNPCSYQSDSLSLVTPVQPLLLSSMHQALDRLDGIPDQALVAVNRKIIGKTCLPKFWHVPRSSSRRHLIEMVRKRCKLIIAQLEEGYLPKNLAKALSVMNLYWKQKLRSMDISQLEFFPFSKETTSLQNDVLNALWSLPNIKHDDLKFLRPILDPDSNNQNMQFGAALRRYLMECLFECDEGNLPGEALRAIAFINRASRCRSVDLTEQRTYVEVDAVLNNMDGPCSSNDTPKAADTDDCCSNEFTRATHHVPEAEHSDLKLEDLALVKTVDMYHLKTSMRSKDLSKILLLIQNGEMEELTKHYLGEDFAYEGPRDTRELMNAAEKNLKGDILVDAVECILPNLPRSCTERVKRLMS